VPETNARNRHHKFNAGFWCQFFVLIASGTKKLAPIYGVKINKTADDLDAAFLSTCDYHSV